MTPKAAEQLADETDALDGEELDAEELERLNNALDGAEAQYQRGEYVDAEVVLRELRSRSAARR